MSNIVFFTGSVEKYASLNKPANKPFDYLMIALNGGLTYLFYLYANTESSCWAAPYSGAIASLTQVASD